MSTLPNSGQIAFTSINSALGRSTRNQLALSDTQLRTLTGIPSGQLRFMHFYGRSLSPYNAVFELNFEASSLPTTDTYGAALTVSPTPPSMSNNSTKGYVFSTAANGYLYTTANFSFPTSYSKSAWIYPFASTITTANIISSYDGVATHYLWYYNNTNVGAGHSSTGAVNTYVTDPNVPPVNAWTHYVVTYDNTTTTMKLYRNGSNVSTATNAAMAWTGSAGKLSIGSYGAGNVFNGYIDNARVYNSVLTAANVESIYTSESGWVPKMVANYDFRDTSSYSGTSSTSVKDLTGSYNLTFNSAPTYNTSPYNITLTATQSATSSSVNIDISGGYSFEVLFKFSSNPGTYPKLMSYAVSNDSNGLQLQIDTNNKIYLWNTIISSGLTSANALSTNTWYHIVITSAGLMFINGSSVSTTGSYSSIANASRVFAIGDQANTRTVPCSVALARFYNAAITSSQVTSLYSAAKASGNYSLP